MEIKDLTSEEVDVLKTLFLAPLRSSRLQNRPIRLIAENLVAWTRLPRHPSIKLWTLTSQGVSACLELGLE